MTHAYVNGVDLEYVDEGTGVPVVFSHGGGSHLRYWEPQREAFAVRYRFVAYSHRFHGSGAWPTEGDYSAEAHVADLLAIMRRLEAGPVHLVGFSTGIALRAALHEPGLVRSLTIIEPNVPWVLEGSPEGEAVLARWRDENERVDAEAAGDIEGAAKLWFELVNNRGPGAFDAQPEGLCRMWLDNFGTKRPTAPPPEPLTCEKVSAITDADACDRGRVRHALLAADRRHARRVHSWTPPRRRPRRDTFHQLPGARPCSTR